MSRTRRLLLGLSLVFTSGADAAGDPPAAAPAPPVVYVGPRAVEAALSALQSDRAKLVVYGASAAGRPLHALRIGRSDLPQVLVHGGCGARDAAGTAAALDFAKRVLSAPAPGPLERVGFVVVPAPNPDALASFLREPGGPGRPGPVPTLGGLELFVEGMNE